MERDLLDVKLLAARRVAMSREWSYLSTLSLHDVIRLWIAVVALAERGYPGEWEDFERDVSIREYIDELASGLPTNWQDRINRDLSDWDARFLAATEEIDRVKADALSARDKWWWRREPKKWRDNHPGYDLGSV